MNIRILIADDHAIVRRGLIQLLKEEYPHAVFEEVDNADELVKKAIADKWNVVISDISMPGRSGIDALQQIKKAVPGLPVLIMSMYPEEQYAIRAFKAGASGYLAKETVHFNLIKAVQTVLGGRKFITSSIAEKMISVLDEEGDKQPHENLSTREFEVFKLIVAGKSVSVIAETLAVNITTISTYRSRILEKMGMRSNAEMIRYAVEKNII